MCKLAAIPPTRQRFECPLVTIFKLTTLKQWYIVGREQWAGKNVWLGQKQKREKKNSPKSMANKPKTLRHLTPQDADHQCQHCTHWQNWFQSLFNGFPCSHLCCCSISPWLNKLGWALKCKFIHIFLQLLWFHWVYVPDHTFSKFLIFQQPGVVFTCLDGELPSSSSSTRCHCDVSC